MSPLWWHNDQTFSGDLHLSRRKDSFRYKRRWVTQDPTYMHRLSSRIVPWPRMGVRSLWRFYERLCPSWLRSHLKWLPMPVPSRLRWGWRLLRNLRCLHWTWQFRKKWRYFLLRSAPIQLSCWQKWRIQRHSWPNLIIDLWEMVHKILGWLLEGPRPKDVPSSHQLVRSQPLRSSQCCLWLHYRQDS